MYKLKKNLQIVPPSLPDEPLKIINPDNGNWFLVDKQQLEILRSIAQMSVPEASNKLEIKENQITNFIDELLKKDFLDEISQNTSSQKAEIELRSDLDFSQNGNYLDIKDLKSEQIFSFDFQEAYLLHRLTESSLQSIAKETNTKEASIKAFIQSLIEKKLLIRPTISDSQKTFLKGNIFSFLFYKVEFKNIDQFLQTINKKFSWLWNWPLAGLHLAIIFFGLFLLIENSTKMKDYIFSQLFHLSWFNLLFGLILIPLIFSLNNLAKGLTFNSFGATSKQSQILYTFALPWFWLDISETKYLNSNLSKNLIIWSGILFEIWLICLNIILWSFSSYNRGLGNLYFNIFIFTVFNLIFSFYILVQDYIQINKRKISEKV